MFHFPGMRRLLALAWLLCGVAAQAQPFTNGGFEINTGTPIPPNTSVTLNPGDTWLTGWSAGGPDGSVTVQNGDLVEAFFGVDLMTPWQGEQWVIFPDDSQGGSLSQTFSTPIGEYFTISFAATFVFSADDPLIGVTAEASNDTMLTNNVYALNNREWTSFELSFIATTAETTLTFYDASPDAEGADIGLDGVALAVEEPPGWPYIITSPQSTTNGAGTEALFTASAGGNPSTVQWYLGSSVVTNATNTTLIVIASEATAGSYTAVFSNSAGTSVSEPAILTVLQVITPPLSQTASLGSQVTFGASASLSNATVQWYLGPAPVPGAISPTLTVTANNQTAGNYTAQFTLGMATATSAAALLTVLDIPFINGSFESQSVGLGNFQTGDAGDIWLTGWDFGGTNDEVFVFNGPFLGLYPADGSQWVIFDSELSPPRGVLSQTFSTTAGQAYLVTFSAMAVYDPDDGPSFKSLVASALDSGGPLLASTNIVPPTNDWATNQLIFTALTTNTVLTFTDGSDPNFGPSVALDAVTVVETDLPPPPPPANFVLTPLSSKPASGSFIVQLAGPSGKTCIMETSTNLMTWFPVSTNVLAGSTVNITNSVIPGATRQFWTVVPAP
jgi:hypothetical protein